MEWSRASLLYHRPFQVLLAKAWPMPPRGAMVPLSWANLFLVILSLPSCRETSLMLTVLSSQATDLAQTRRVSVLATI